MEELIQKLTKAIETKSACMFTYKGKLRQALPFMLGQTHDDRTVLHCLQIGGEGSRGSVTEPAWRLFYLDEIDDEEVVLASYTAPEAWPVTKSEGAYQPPAFVAEVLALVQG